MKYYRFAADKGDTLGLHNLGYAYNAGLLGLQRDANELARLVLQALEGKYEVTVQSLTNRPESGRPNSGRACSAGSPNAVIIPDKPTAGSLQRRWTRCGGLADDNIFGNLSLGSTQLLAPGVRL